MKKLIISPHADDEVYGCSSILDKESFVYYCGIDESLLDPDPEHRIKTEEKINEIKKVADLFGFNFKFNLTNKVNHYIENELIKQFEEIINEIKPEMIFIPLAGFNQDHRAAYNALQVALRPHDKNFFVKKVLIYEQEHTILWNPEPYKVNYFVPLDIKKKIDAYFLYKSQVRKMRPEELFISLAKIRGVSINKDYAEAFIVERWVE